MWNSEWMDRELGFDDDGQRVLVAPLDQQQQQVEAQKQQAISTYYRAFAACLEGRGYSIK